MTGLVLYIQLEQGKGPLHEALLRIRGQSPAVEPSSSQAVVTEPPAPAGERHMTTAEMLLPNGELLVIDQWLTDGDVRCSLATLPRRGGSATVLYRNPAGMGLLGGISPDGRRFYVEGPDGVYEVDRHEGPAGWFSLPDQVVEDLEAGMTVTRSLQSDGVYRYHVYRGSRVVRGFRFDRPLEAARLSPGGAYLGLLASDSLYLLPMEEGSFPVTVAVRQPVLADLVVSDAGYALVVREDRQAVGLAGPQGIKWFEVSVPDVPLEAGVAKLHPQEGRFAISDGTTLYVGDTRLDQLVPVRRLSSGVCLHVGEWNVQHGILFTEIQGWLYDREPGARDRFFVLDMDYQRGVRELTPDIRYPGALENPALCSPQAQGCAAWR
ncbi:MAG TPA: hypothetical protein VNO81_10760 [Candidatus Nitrosotenuis sp.]|nr:hypothetical protein [Candidatus Nitrosotenuis sp.]